MADKLASYAQAGQAKNEQDIARIMDALRATVLLLRLSSSHRVHRRPLAVQSPVAAHLAVSRTQAGEKI